MLNAGLTCVWFRLGMAGTRDRGTKLRIVTTKNQDTPLPQGLVPLLPLDVWEHSYFLQYYSERAAYIKNWFALIDWSYVEKRYLNEHS